MVFFSLVIDLGTSELAASCTFHASARPDGTIATLYAHQQVPAQQGTAQFIHTHTVCVQKAAIKELEGPLEEDKVK